MNRRTFLKSAAASAVLAKLGPVLTGALPKPVPAPKFQPYQLMYFDSTPTGDRAYSYQLWAYKVAVELNQLTPDWRVPTEKRPLAS